MKVKDIQLLGQYCVSKNGKDLEIRVITRIPVKGRTKKKEETKFHFVQYTKQPAGTPVFQKSESVSPELMLPWIRKAIFFKGKLPEVPSKMEVTEVVPKFIKNSAPKVTKEEPALV